MTLTIYGGTLSPFVARCWIQVQAKRLPVTFLPVPGSGKPSDPGYRTINPLGKIPALIDDGRLVPECEVICEYLEDRFPEPSLRPSTPAGRAQMRLISRIVDLYGLSPMIALFFELWNGTRRPDVIAAESKKFLTALDHLDHFLSDGPYAAGEKLTLADCALIPQVFFAFAYLPPVGVREPLAGRGKLDRWWRFIGNVPVGRSACAMLEHELRVWWKPKGSPPAPQ
ncbi:MAG: glutathione S-transferase family protein [Alphaproteobacteria bacterium]|nr:glutathione S-transferase family protein [Alphaproteobacteria bacterium]